MVGKVLTIVIVFAINASHGQLLDIFVPGLSNTVRETAGGLTNSPGVDQTSQSTGNLITNTFELLTSVPIAAARALGGFNGVPSLINDNNIIDYGDDIIGEYNIGLGNEDVNLSIDQLIVKYGYPVEKHNIVTEDGYILTVFRIPSDGPVVFLMHGLIGSSDDYVVAGPESGLAYLLANEGYDVWIGNGRGNKHSRSHVELKPSQAIFWKFSWHEIGYYDLPAMIDYALNTTGQEKLKYIGHSQGTTSFWVMGSERPEYNDKVALMVALAPVAFVSKMKSPIVRSLAPVGGIIHAFTKSLGVYELLPENKLTKFFRRLMCGTGPVAEILCSNMLFMIAGFNVAQLNITNLPVIYSHAPSGASAQQVAHYGQNFITRKFRKFDYGVDENMRLYGTPEPPDYNLENVRAPVSMIYSDHDWLVHPDDVDELYNKLPNVIDIHKVDYTNFNHLDYIWAKDVKYLIFKRLSQLLTYF